MQTLTPAILLKIIPNIGSIERAVTLANLINTICPKYKIDSTNSVRAFLAQTAWESGGFNRKTENLYYSTAHRVYTTFPTHFASETEAGGYTANPAKLANRVYSSRLGNGDEASGDGFTFRGGGYIQLTGKDLYKDYAKYIIKDIETAAGLVRTTDQYALDSACWFFTIEKDLLPLAQDESDFEKLTYRINGGYNGIGGRKALYELTKQYIV